MIKKIMNHKIKIAIGVFLAVVLHPILFSSGPSEASLKSRVVKLQSARGSCSGEQVKAPSGVDYILTAAHCRTLADETGSIQVKTEDGRELMRRVIAEDENSDLLLLEGLPGVEGLPIAQAQFPGQKVRTFTHGRGFDTYKTEGVLIQLIHVEIPLFSMEDGSKERCDLPKHKVVDSPRIFLPGKTCMMSADEILTTALIVPGSSGGMVVNRAGELIGVVSAGDGTFGLLVTLHDIHDFVDNY